MRSVLNKDVEKIKVHILCSVTFFRKSRRLQDNVEKYGGAWGAPNITIWIIRVARWMSKATCTRACTLPRARAHARTRAHAHPHTYTHVKFSAFPRQQWFRERASVLRYTYIVIFIRLIFIRLVIFIENA